MFLNKLYIRLLKGFLSIIPLVLVALIINYIYSIFRGIYVFLFGTTDSQFLTIFILFVSVLVIYYIGYLIEKKQEFTLLELLEKIIIKIPILKTILLFIKELINMFSPKTGKEYLGVVKIELLGQKVLGFITKETHTEYTIYIPTSPNPTSGYVVFVNKNSTTYEKLNITPKEAMATIISLGVK